MEIKAKKKETMFWIPELKKMITFKKGIAKVTNEKEIKLLKKYGYEVKIVEKVEKKNEKQVEEVVVKSKKAKIKNEELVNEDLF